MPRLLATQRDGRTIEPKFERIATERAPQERELGALDETENHEALDGRIGSINRFDPSELAGFEVTKRQSLTPKPQCK